MEDYPATMLEFEKRFATENTCHEYIAQLRWPDGTHQGAVRPSHLDYCLDEYTFRFNRRTSRSQGKVFYRLVQQAVAIDLVTGDDIRGGIDEA